MRKLALFALLLLVSLAVASAQDWPMIGYDNSMARNSPQTTIGKDNVNQLQIKWILNTNFTIENPPLIIGKYVFSSPLEFTLIGLRHISTARFI